MKKQLFIYILNFANYFLSGQRTLSCPPYHVFHLLSSVSRVLSPVLQYVSSLIFPISRLLAPVSCLLPPVSLFISPFSCLPSTVSCLPSPCFPSPVSHLLSPIYCLMSPVSRLPCCYCCRYNLQYNHFADLTISWRKSADFGILAIFTLLADLKD